MTSQNDKYMQMALELARQGIGAVEPNPAVGCVIVKGGEVIARGWHKKFGEPHAEINALEDCTDAAGATMYVNLEPCCHEGKTGPCTDAIIKAGLAKVVIAMVDPSNHAGGKGIEQLRKAGIEVELGICETEAKLLNAPFIKFAVTGKSWVILKWAQSIDGKMAWTGQADGRRWISGEQSREDAHNLRRRVQGILVGIGTVLADDPLLIARPSKGEVVTRIVLDSRLRIPLDSKLLATAGEMPVLILTNQGASEAEPQKCKQITEKGAEIVTYPEVEGRSNLEFVLDELSKRGIGQLLVEGGANVIDSFIEEGIFDEICVYIAQKKLGDEGCVGISDAMAELAKAVGLQYVDIKRFGKDLRISGFSKRGIGAILAAGG
ncbi:MAG: bifunctional diaminohydroxyphosphoribosylaminopyrimidine deaminase/5-amino-6-(5-phosphoribosylamino)uracil reductase RibD [Planctomycetes bacterium]|nr:bifunctional diaminohydroxyphosphoribosylaminopyrimidine deaminase/5-amino-6-(5-phosphoribosylamino)uracil reductase RibD [Planctomycetota bacterium]